MNRKPSHLTADAEPLDLRTLEAAASRAAHRRRGAVAPVEPARTPSTLPRRSLGLLTLALLSAACTSNVSDEQASQAASALKILPPVGGGGGISLHPTSYADGVFTLHAMGNRCWDFGGQAYWQVHEPVTLYTCNGSVAQQVRVKEVSGSHDVELRVPNTNLCIGVANAVVSVGQALELQVCNETASGTSLWDATQAFAYDGDAIMMGTQSSINTVTRDFVIEPSGDASVQHAPLVVGTRQVSDAEYFTMVPVAPTTGHPTSGFVRVTSEAELDLALTRGWGTVIEVDDAAPLVITSLAMKEIHAGTTLRGYRKYTYQGPLISFPSTAGTPADPALIPAVFDVQENHVRVTGLRMQGPNQTIDISPPDYGGIRVVEQTAAGAYNDVFIDHLDTSGWTGVAVDIYGADPDDYTCWATPLPMPRQAHVHVVDNFIHHNQKEGSGYGTAVGNGAFALFAGNVAYDNRHTLTADPSSQTAFQAVDNLVLSETPGYPDRTSLFGGTLYEPNFDKHGSGTTPSTGWTGGISDDYADMGWNTFLSTKDKYNIYERGTPCRTTSVHDSIFARGNDGTAFGTYSNVKPIVASNNTFSDSSFVNDLAVGNFDGDGYDDIFVGTGAGWWFSSGAQGEWRFLNRMTERASQLRFGDFDGDGRTDVVALHGRYLDVSWAGISPWQTVNVFTGVLSDLAVGDFDGDHVSDLFSSNGTTWSVAFRGLNWQFSATSAYHTTSLRFGDFNGDGRTDVFGVVAGQWMYVPGGQGSWLPLGPAWSSAVAGFVVADFDGDGDPDVGLTDGNMNWQYSSGGVSGLHPLRTGADALAGHPVGRFDSDSRADVLMPYYGGDPHFWFASGAHDPVVTVSRQEMR